jgi:hypothetical protein
MSLHEKYLEQYPNFNLKLKPERANSVLLSKTIKIPK